MGGGVANKDQANAANANATAGAARSTAIGNRAVQTGTDLSKTSQDQATQYGAERQQMYNTLFGSPGGAPGGAPSTPGALTGFLDPSKLNVSSPQGPYAQMYTRQNEQLATDTANAKAAAQRDAATRGFGAGSPAGFTQDRMLKADLGAAQTRGTNFANATNNSYQDALNNFWKSVSTAQQQGGQAQTGQLSATEQAGKTAQEGTSQAVQAQQGANSTYGQLYGTAGAYHQSPITQAAIGAGGTAGSAAITCVCEGTPILMADGRYEAVENLRPGDRIRAAEGATDQVLAVDVHDRVPCSMISTVKGRYLRGSDSHTVARTNVGYVNLSKALGIVLLAYIPEGYEDDTVIEVTSVGVRRVYQVKLLHAHAYVSAGLWSLE